MLRFFERRLDPFPDAPPPPLAPTFLRFLWTSTAGARWYLLLLTLTSAAFGLFEAALFAFLGDITDWLVATPPDQLFTTHARTLWLLAALLLGSVGLAAINALLKQQTLSGNLPMLLRWQYHRRLLGQSLGFFQDEFSGRLATKVIQTAGAVRDAWMTVADILVYVVIYFASMTFILGGFDSRMLLPFAGWLVCYIAAMRWFIPRLATRAEAQADARSLMTGRIADAYTNIATVKLFSHTQREAGHARSAMREYLGTVHAQLRLVTGFEIVNQLLSVVLIGGTTGLALWLFSRGEVGVGAVAAAAAMSMRLNGLSHWIMWEMASLFEHVGTVQDGLQTLSQPVTVTDAPNATALVVTRGEVRFDDLSFDYGSGRPVLDRVSLTIRPGEKIGLVGRSGAGKSTLVNLLLRFHDLSHGRITIDGQDIAHVTQDSLRAAIGMVTQDTSLLHRSVRDNIAYGRPDADDAAIEAAARRAEAHEFIQSLHDPKGRTGYDAHVGERGVKLSGGQRQRIAIARVMLKDAPILVLDEATSALDSEVEAAIQDTLYRLMDGKTVIAIAHRLSTIAAMDRLVVMEQGRIVESGTHAALLDRGGIYARLWAHQSGGFIGDEPTAPMTAIAGGVTAPPV
jgi:ATP-binding cassette subfamily B multidrug efflux pump